LFFVFNKGFVLLGQVFMKKMDL